MLYQAQKGLAGDSTAMNGTIMAIDAANQLLFGSGIIEGMLLSSAGVIAAGYALIGHVIHEPGGTNLASLFSGSGVFDLYVQAPTAVYNTAGLATSGVVAGSGYDAPSYVEVASGTTPSGGGAIIATVTVSGGSIVSVVDKRQILVTAASVSNALADLSYRQVEVYGALSAPLPNAVLFACPFAMSIQSLMLFVTTAPVGQSIIARVQHLSGGVWSDVWTSAQGYPSIAAGSLSGTASSPLGSASCAAGDLISVQLTQVGSTTAGSDLVIVLGYVIG
jgi:hypothetical protein